MFSAQSTENLQVSTCVTVKIIVQIFIKFNLPMALYILFCKDVENYLVRTFTLFPKHVTFTSRYGQLVLGNSLIILPNFFL